MDKVWEHIKTGVRNGRYREVSAEHVFIHILSFCAFPFALRPALQANLSERKKEIPKLMFNVMKK